MKHFVERSAPLTGILSVACTVVGTLMILGQPQDKDSNASIVAYFAVHSHRVKGVAGFFVFLAGIMLLLAFLTVLRERLLEREGGTGRLSTLTFGAGIAATSLWMVSMLLGNATMFASTSTSHFHVDPNTYRMLGDTAYFAWIAALAVGAVVVWATSAVALRTSVLPRWFGFVGLVAGVSMLFGLYFFPFFAWWLWVVVTSILLVARRGQVAVAPVPAVG